MVRTKDKPSHIDLVQQRKNLLNEQSLSHSYSDSIPGSSTAEEAILIDLINDEDEDEDEDYEPPAISCTKNNVQKCSPSYITVEDDDDNDEDDDEDEDYEPPVSRTKNNVQNHSPSYITVVNDDDYEYKPPVSRKRNVVKETSLRETPKKVRQKKPKKKEIDYGLFKTVLENCSFCIKIDTKFSLKNVHCLFGELSLEISDFSDNDLIIQEAFWLYVSQRKDESAIYFEWFHNDEEILSSPSPNKNKYKKVKANKFKYFHVVGCLDFDLWAGIRVRYFQVVFDKFENNSLFLKVYLLKSGIANLQYSSEFYKGNKAIAAVCSHFYGIKPLEKDDDDDEDELHHNHDIESFYKAIYKVHQDAEYSNVDVQHPYLIPELRPYQKRAVNWMLHQERIEGHSLNENKLHPLYVEIPCIDKTPLYYNYYGGFFLSNKPLEVASSPGGILADEMGLGKTVEVLACIMCHFREKIPKTLNQYEDSENLIKGTDLSQESTSTPFVQNVNEKVEFSSNFNQCKIYENHSPEEKIKVESNISNVELEPETSEAYDGHTRIENDNNCQIVNGKNRIARSFDSIKDSDEESEYDSIHTDDHLILQQQNKEVDFESSGERPKRKTVQRIASYFENSADYYDDDDSYKPKSKKIKFEHIQKTQSYADQEIAKNSVLSITEKVILEKCWDGVLKDYKTMGSYKEFRKFLKKRKADPYYLMSLKEKLNIEYLRSLAEYSAAGAVNRSTLQDFFETTVKKKSFFECVCGRGDKGDRDEMSRVQCTVCTLWQHAYCVQFKQCDIGKRLYICPHCWTLQPPVISGATLIVAPASISHQWVEEIEKHIKEKSMKVFVYSGVSSHGYIQPYNLACYDIVITTYETLRREVNYIDLPHSNSDAGRRFRFPKRFMATPSPLLCIEWWRVCLDEAQMVECTTTKTAEMAVRLSAVHRWCITGTPIQKTVNDLQGLLMFLGVDPYCVPQWWKRCLYNPYCRGNTEPLHALMARYMWRNSKLDVIYELDIPSQSEEIHWLNFTQVEEHFYKRLHADCSNEALRRINKFSNKTTKLSALDKRTLSSLLQPLLKLRQACDHPQVVKGLFIGLNRKTLTMEQLLDNLLKKTQLEVEDTHRIIVASLNGLAALDIIKQNFCDAVEKYREVLRSVEEHNENFKTDSLQQLHTLHNLAEIIQSKPEGVQPTLRDDKLAEEAKGIRDRYLKLYPQKIAEAETECNQNTHSVEEQKSKFNNQMNWWIIALESFDKEFIQEVRLVFLSNYTKFEERKCLLYPIHTNVQLMNLLKTKLKMMENQRKAMLSSVGEFLKLDPVNILDGAIDCHLRPCDDKSVTCKLCYAHELILEYEKNLFYIKDIDHSRSTDRAKETKEFKEKLKMLDKTREGNWSQGDIERVLRYLQTKSLGRLAPDVYEDSQTHLLVLQAMKKEYKNFRILLKAIHDHVSALDEVNMATLRFRLRFPGEELPQTKKKKDQPSDELEKKADAPKYVLEEAEVSQQEMKLKTEKIVAQNDLRVKLGRLFYLQNLKKVNFGTEGNANPDPCPVCQGKLGCKWKVLLCGHSYCIDCITMLIRRIHVCSANASIKCPICRQPTRIREIAHIDMQSRDVDDSIKVTGSLSTKIGGVVRTMLKIKTSDPEAKVLIFSSWNDVLEVIADGLAQNGITYRMLQSDKKKFQVHLSSFKSKQEITALLLPITSGANGLNLVEARHVILVEPILNPAAEVQAIGRIHRIGQTNATVVHRFLIHDTIEERMYSILHPKYLENSAEDNSLTIEELYQLFTKDLDHKEEDEEE